MFYFQQLLNTALAGIDGTSIIASVTGIAYAILLIGFLVGLYQAGLRGGDLHLLAITGVKYLVVAIILANWGSVFHQVNASCDDVAQFIANSSGAGDMYNNWLNQIRQHYDTTGNLSLWDLITGAKAGEMTAEFLILAYVVYACALVIFSFFYALYGAVLYVVGPLVLALLPMAGIGQLARTYAVNVMIWNAWGILYAVFGALMTAINVNNTSNVLGQQGFLGYFHGLGDTMLLGLASIFFALSLALIPLVARRVISGDVGSSMLSLVRAGAFVAANAVAGAAGFSSGATQGAGAGAASSAGGGAASSLAGSASLVSSMPPPVPSLAGSIRSGMMSAMRGTAPSGGAVQGGSSPPAPASRTVVMQFGGGGGEFRPKNLTQAATYHAAKIAGRTLAGASRRLGSDEEA